MLSFPPAVRIWLCVQPTDLRKSFDSLAELVRQQLQDDPLSGHVFVFRNRRSDLPEPREAVVADLTGDGKNDLAVLVHDRIVVYSQE